MEKGLTANYVQKENIYYFKYQKLYGIFSVSNWHIFDNLYKSTIYDIFTYSYKYICMYSWKLCTLPVITKMILRQLKHLGIWWTEHFVSKCMGCHKTIVMETGRTHCFHDYIHITPILLLWDLSMYSICHGSFKGTLM